MERSDRRVQEVVLYWIRAQVAPAVVGFRSAPNRRSGVDRIWPRLCDGERLVLTSVSVRRRVALELGALVVSATLFLALVPQRPLFLDLGFALLALGLVALTARDTRECVWGTPSESVADRVRHSTRHLLIATATVVAIFAAWRIVIGGPFLTSTLLAAFVLFVPWALLQQVLLQFYLLGRVSVLLADAPRLVVSLVNGLLFGAAHLPDWDLALVTIVAGSIWSWYYLRDRCLLPIALSHAALGPTYFYWIRGQDLIQAGSPCCDSGPRALTVAFFPRVAIPRPRSQAARPTRSSRSWLSVDCAPVLTRR